MLTGCFRLGLGDLKISWLVAFITSVLFVLSHLQAINVQETILSSMFLFTPFAPDIFLFHKLQVCWGIGGCVGARGGMAVVVKGII